ncbi:hypothetical protein [Nonlabens xiamenensis]|uniref:hypothetical protein n=1 Tax=Nonlabens xiamenensis TaxID=2341043 RepID=UPI000F61419E|nr:hypothetical protein [Nonlabens xiamenensis]
MQFLQDKELAKSPIVYWTSRDHRDNKTRFGIADSEKQAKAILKKMLQHRKPWRKPIEVTKG